ncbi:phosphate-starvation-inducible PsiE family protein [uncultured Croceitalea sp.]|uniref:phosphate-starvation-inducible PsiE family protein n=1 Tax=uncultured Croceitalea sp. TaxID=1798908 RepID=UPI0033066C69
MNNPLTSFWKDKIDPKKNYLEYVISRLLALLILVYCFSEFIYLLIILGQACSEIFKVISEHGFSSTELLSNDPSESYIRLALRNIINILIFFEILETFKAPSASAITDDNETQSTQRNLRWVKIIFLVSIIAVLRKIILFDFTNQQSDKIDLSFVGPSVILIVLTICYIGFKYVENKKW